MLLLYGEKWVIKEQNLNLLFSDPRCKKKKLIDFGYVFLALVHKSAYLD